MEKPVVIVDEKGRNMPTIACRFEAMVNTNDVIDYSTSPDGGILVYLLSTATGQTFKFAARDNVSQSNYITLTDEKGFFPVLVSKIDWTGTTQTVYRIR